jgi:hypothetical protein
VSVELTPAEFDVCGPLPTGVTVLEASAGTGKTYTIAALAARYVAEGIPLNRLLLVTFTRIATGELRERVRDRLVSAERGLGQAIDGVLAEQDEVVALLANGPPAEVQKRRAPARPPASTRRRSRQPMAFARRCWVASGSRATSSPTSRSSRISPTSRAR